MSSYNEMKKLKEEITLLTKELNMLRYTGMVELSVIIMVNDKCRKRDAIDTLLAQVYSNFEVICMYSGVSDEVYMELKQYQTQSSNFIVYHSDTASGIENLKSALEFARGSYVMLLSPYVWLSDDHSLFSLMSRIKQGELDAVLAKCSTFKSQDGRKEILSSCIFKKQYMTKAVKSCEGLKYYFCMPILTYLKNESEKIEFTDDVVCVTKLYETGVNDKLYSGMFYEHYSEETDMIIDYLYSVYWLMVYLKNKNMNHEYSAIYYNLINNWLKVITTTFLTANDEVISLISKIASLIDKNILLSVDAFDFIYDNDIYVRMIMQASK